MEEVVACTMSMSWLLPPWDAAAAAAAAGDVAVEERTRREAV